MYVTVKILIKKLKGFQQTLMSDERFISSSLNKKDDSFEESLRPQGFDEFAGQKKVKERLELFVRAASERNEPLGHVLLSGPPGLGKTTLAYIIANTKGANIKSSSGPVIEKPGDLAGLLTSLQEGDILFIDEIHRLQTAVEEYLYSAMEDYFIDIMIDQGAGARSIRLNLKKFTLIGATTRKGLLSSPLRSRFNLDCLLDYYPPEDLQIIIVRSAKILNIEIDEDGALEIARRSRGTSRIANNLLRWARDYAQVKADNFINAQVASDALDMLDIDENGLDEMDKKILDCLVFRFSQSAVGIKNIAVAVGEEVGTIEEVYEPFLIQEGYILRTRLGRVATERSIRLMRKLSPEDKVDGFDQPSLL